MDPNKKHQKAVTFRVHPGGLASLAHPEIAAAVEIPVSEAAAARRDQQTNRLARLSPLAVPRGIFPGARSSVHVSIHCDFTSWESTGQAKHKSTIRVADQNH